MVGMLAAHNVILDEKNLVEGEMTVLEPRAVLYRPRLGTLE